MSGNATFSDCVLWHLGGSLCSLALSVSSTSSGEWVRAEGTHNSRDSEVQDVSRHQLGTGQAWAKPLCWVMLFHLVRLGPGAVLPAASTLMSHSRLAYLSNYQISLSPSYKSYRVENRRPETSHDHPLLQDAGLRPPMTTLLLQDAGLRPSMTTLLQDACPFLYAVETHMSQKSGK